MLHDGSGADEQGPANDGHHPAGKEQEPGQQQHGGQPARQNPAENVPESAATSVISVGYFATGSDIRPAPVSAHCAL